MLSNTCNNSKEALGEFTECWGSINEIKDELDFILDRVLLAFDKTPTCGAQKAYLILNDIQILLRIFIQENVSPRSNLNTHTTAKDLNYSGQEGSIKDFRDTYGSFQNIEPKLDKLLLRALERNDEIGGNDSSDFYSLVNDLKQLLSSSLSIKQLK